MHHACVHVFLSFVVSNYIMKCVSVQPVFHKHVEVYLQVTTFFSKNKNYCVPQSCQIDHMFITNLLNKIAIVTVLYHYCCLQGEFYEAEEQKPIRQSSRNAV